MSLTEFQKWISEFGRRPVVLIVDDEPEMLGLLGAEFQDVGFEALTAGSVSQALEMIRRHSVDVVLSDIRMPGGSGLDFFMQLKSFGPKRPHFLFMSAFSDIDVSRALDLGAEAVLKKPFQTQRVIEQIQYLLGPRVQNWMGSYQGKPPNLSISKNLSYTEFLNGIGILRMGKAGFFLKLDPIEIPPVRELIAFKFDFEDSDQAAFQGIGKIRWVRLRPAAGYPCGCGVEIIHLIESSRHQMEESLAQQKPEATIPAA